VLRDWAYKHLRLGRGFSAALLLVSFVAVLPGTDRGNAQEFRLAETDEWMERVRRGEFWGSSGSGSTRYSEPDRPSRLRKSVNRPEASTGNASASLSRWGSGSSGAQSWKGGTYRTVCVRLCDGYYWPVSFATTPSRFAGDEQACARQCSSPARLYVYPNPGAAPEQMTDLSGAPYTKLTTAFLYRSEYKEDCTCKPAPWSEEALSQHRIYALEERQRKGDKAARAELARIKSGSGAGEGSGGGKREAKSGTTPQDEKRR
jgi:hypothetical protein